MVLEQRPLIQAPSFSVHTKIPKTLTVLSRKQEKKYWGTPYCQHLFSLLYIFLQFVNRRLASFTFSTWNLLKLSSAVTVKIILSQNLTTILFLNYTLHAPSFQFSISTYSCGTWFTQKTNKEVWGLPHWEFADTDQCPMFAYRDLCEWRKKKIWENSSDRSEEEIVSFLLLLFILLGPSEIGGTRRATFPLFSLFPWCCPSFPFLAVKVRGRGKHCYRE